jgi:hypothetical protein
MGRAVYFDTVFYSDILFQNISVKNSLACGKITS